MKMPTIQERLSEAEQQYRAPADLARNTIGRVIGFGIGPKITKHKEMPGAECIRFYVEKKHPNEAVPDRFRIDKEYKGELTDVIETGRIVSFQARSQARPGSSLGLDQRNLRPNIDPARTGTLTAIVELEGKYYVLGSNHAMAVNGRATGARVIFRPPNEFIVNPSDYIFAHVTDHVHLTHPGPNRVDCALAKIDDRFQGRVNAVFQNEIEIG